MMNIKELIAKKRDGGCLDPDELKFFASAAADGSIPDYQVSAMLMAMYIKGLNTDETVALTLAMAHSGALADLSGIKGVKGDKHSTGGVGDKTTLIGRSRWHHAANRAFYPRGTYCPTDPLRKVRSG